MKRFTATEIWQKEWFQALTPGLKCLWQYLCANCDAGGVWDVNWRMASFCIGETFDVTSVIAFGERVEVLPNGKVWIVGFCGFQYGQLSRECRAQNHVFRILEKHGLLDRVQNTLNTLSDTLFDRVSDRDREEDKDKDSEKGELGSINGDFAHRKREELRAIAVRVGAIMHRRVTCKWSDSEKQALVAIYPVPEETLAAVEQYYADQWPPNRETNILRHDLTTLLNNWSGETDRALRHVAGNGGGISRANAPRSNIDPADFARWLTRRYPRADSHTTPLTADFSIIQEYLDSHKK